MKMNFLGSELGVAPGDALGSLEGCLVRAMGNGRQLRRVSATRRLDRKFGVLKKVIYLRKFGTAQPP